VRVHLLLVPEAGRRDQHERDSRGQ
jgi:hypothetical protein